MIRRVGAVLAWALATVVAMALAASAVGSMRGEVTAVPAVQATTPLSAPALASATSITSAITTPTTAAAPTTVATTVPTSTTTTEPPVATTSTVTTTAPDTTTPPTTTSTTVANPPVKSTHQLVGGQVTITSNDPMVALVAAVPTNGFSAEVEQSGPNEVEVKFKSDAHKSTFRAKWDNGELDIDIKEEEDD